jgi:hypothetical protein
MLFQWEIVWLQSDGDVLILTRKYVLKFVNFKDEIKIKVDFLRFGITLEFFLTIDVIVYSNGFISESKSQDMNLLRIRINENDLSFILNRWLNLKVEDSIRIDMDYIEKYSKQFIEKKSNDVPNVL